MLWKRWLTSSAKRPFANPQHVKSLVAILDGAAANPGGDVAALLDRRFESRILSRDSFREAIAQVRSAAVAKGFFDWASSRQGFVHDRYTYNAFLSAFVRAGHLDDALEYLTSRTIPIAPDVASYNILIGGLCSASRFSQAFQLLKEMEALGMERSNVTHGIVLKALCESKDVDRALRYFYSVSPRSVLDVVSYTTLMVGLAVSGRIDVACELFQEMISLKGECLIAYTAIINGLFKADQPDRALEYFEKLVSGKCQPDRKTYTVVISGLCKAGKLAKAWEAFEEMSRKGWKPDIIVYTSLLDGLSKSGRMDEARKLMQEIVSRGIQPTEVTYTSFVSGLCKHGRVEEAVDLARGMDKEWAREVIHCIIGGYVSIGKIDEAVAFMDKVVNQGVELDVRCYTSLIHGLFYVGRNEEAQEMFEVMARQGCVPDIRTYGMIVSNLCKQGKMKAACDAVEMMDKVGVEANFHIYNSLMDGFLSVNKPSETIRVWDAMLEKKTKPSIVSYHILMLGLCKLGRMADARELLRVMRNKDGVVPTVSSYRSLIDGLGKAGCVEEMVDVFTEMVDNGVIPDCHIYTIIIQALAKAGRMDEATRLLREMPSMGITRDALAFNAVLKVLEVEPAWGVLREMMDSNCAPDGSTFKALKRRLKKEH